MVPPSVEDSFPRTVPTPAQQDDPATVSRVIADLAAHIGPIAEKLVRSELRKGASLPQVVEKMGAEIADEEIRAAFLQKFALPQAKSAALSPSGPNPSGPAPASQRFSAAELAQAEADLAQYIGAVARVVVKRAAAKARDLAELYLLLADEIEDAQEKKKFVRKAISASRPH